MPTPNLIRVWQRAKANNQSQTTVDPNGQSPTVRTRQETWAAQYDGVVDLDTAENAAGLPVAGNVYNGLFCTRKQAVRDQSSPYVVNVLVDYSTQQPSGSTNNNSYNVNIAKSSAASEETTDQDRLGLPLCNTVHNLLPERPQVTLYDTVWTITYTTKVAPNWPDDLEGKTNSDAVTFTICGIRRSYTKSQMKCIKADFQTNKITNGVSGQSLTTTYTYDCVLAFQIRLPKWKWRAPNLGWRGFDSDDNYGTFDVNGKVIADGDTSAIKATEPTALDLTGKALPQGSATLFLPDDAIGQSTPRSRTYADDGAFELEQQHAFLPLFTGLNDSEQVQQVPQ